MVNSMVTIVLSKGFKFWWNLKLYANRRPWIQWWQNCLWFLMPVNTDTCRYWHLSSFRPQFWTKNGKSSNFNEILYFAQTEGGECNGGNSFCDSWRIVFCDSSVNIDKCQYWYLLSFRSRFSTKNGKCSSFDKILYSTQNERGEFNGFDIERYKLRIEK